MLATDLALSRHSGATRTATFIPHSLSVHAIPHSAHHPRHSLDPDGIALRPSHHFETPTFIFTKVISGRRPVSVASKSQSRYCLPVDFFNEINTVTISIYDRILLQEWRTRKIETQLTCSEISKWFRHIWAGAEVVTKEQQITDDDGEHQ